MTTILYLDPDDEIASIKSKVEAIRDETIEIFVPYGLRALRNPVKVRLLHRHLQSLGLHATVVSRDEVVHKLARAEGLRVRKGASAGLALLAPEVVRSQKSFAAYLQERAARVARLRMWKALGLTSLGIAVLFPVLGAMVFLPSATVILRPATRELEEVVQVTASTLASGVEAASLRVPARVLEVDFQVSNQLDTLGVQKDPEGKARGRVTFVSRSSELVEVPAGTRVGTPSGIVFLTAGSISVPPDQPSGVQVAVAAASPGAAANVASREVSRVLDPLLTSRVSVTNERAIEGGSDHETRVVGEEDYWKLRELVLALAQEETRRRLEGLRSGDLSFYGESVRLRITGEELSPPIGQPTAQVSLAVQGRGWVLSFSGRDVNEALRRYFSRQDAAYQLSDGSLEPRVLEVVRFDNDSITFHIKVKALLHPRIDEGQVKAMLQGKRSQEAEAWLAEQLPLTSPPQVRIGPFWADTVPPFHWRITIHQIPRG